MFCALKPNVAFIGVKLSGNRIFAFCIFGAIETTSCKKARELSDTDAEDLIGQNMVQSRGFANGAPQVCAGGTWAPVPPALTGRLPNPPIVNIRS